MKPSDRPIRILVADDSATALACICRYLELEGLFEIVDLLLTDVVMPRMGGKPLVEQMAQIRPRTRVLYMSGYPNDGIVQAGILAKGVALLEKPFTREILSKRVRQVLDDPAPAT